MSDDKIVKYIKQAFELREEKCYKQAIEMLYKALELENDNFEVLFQIGELYFCMLDMDRAIQYLEMVLKKKPSHSKSLRLLKDIYVKEGKFEFALDLMNKLLELNNHCEKDIVNTIELLALMKNVSEINKFESFESLKVKVAVAKAYYTFGNYEKVEKILDDVLAIEPENEDALLLKGKLLFNNNEFNQAKIIFDKLKYDTENHEILNYLGLFSMEELKFVEAVQYFSKALALDSENHRYFYNLGNAYFLNGWFKEASNAYLQAIRFDDMNCDYRYSLAYLYYKNRDFSKAQNEVNYILSLNENHYKTRVLEALLLFEKKDYLAAQNILENNLRLGYDDDFTKLSLAKVYKELLNYDKAQSILAKLSSSDNLDVIYEQADINYRKQQYNEAIDILNKILAVNGNYIKAYSLLAACYFDIDKLDAAKKCAQEAISLDMNFSEGYYYLALVREEEKDFDEAIECLKRAIMCDLSNALYYSKMSDLYLQKNDFSYAFEYIKEAVELDNSSIYKNKFIDLANKKRKIQV